MNLNSLLIKDSSGKPSVTMSAFCLGFTVVNLKLMLGGLELWGHKLGNFSGGEYAAALSALGGIYILRRNFGNPNGNEGK